MEFEKVFEEIEALKKENGGIESEIKKLTELEEYIRNDIGGIINYKEQKGVEIPDAAAGMEYRNLGVMERNIDIFAKRMKGAKSWSEEGATHLSKIIALKMGKGFNDKIAALTSGKLSERLTERFEKVIRNTKAGIHEAVRKSVYPMHRGGVPFCNSKVTNGRKAIRRLFDLRLFSEMVYR